MKRIFSIAILLEICCSMHAQTNVNIYIGGYKDITYYNTVRSSPVVFCSEYKNGSLSTRTIDYGKLANRYTDTDGGEVVVWPYLYGIGANAKGVWAMLYHPCHIVQRGGNTYLSYDKGKKWHRYWLYNEQKRVREFPFTGYGITTLAMRVRGNDVVVAGSYQRQGSKYIESCKFAEVNQRPVFQTEWETKNHCKNVDITSNIFDVDYFKGKVYATGFDWREYSEGTVNKKHKVRACARVYCDGKVLHKQFDNQTSYAYAISVQPDANGNPICFTAGNHRGKVWAWQNTEDKVKGSQEGKITRMAAVPTGNGTYATFYLFDKHLYDSNFIEASGTIRKAEVIDLVDDGTDAYVLAKDNQKLYVYRLRANSARNVHELVRSFDISECPRPAYLAVHKVQ